MAESNTSDQPLAQIDLSKKIRKGSRMRRKKLWLITMMSIVSVLIVEAVAIIVVSVNKTNEVGVEDGEMSGKVISPEAEVKADEYMVEIEEKMAAATDNYEKIIIFQNYIDKIDDEEVVAVLLNKRINYILSFDLEKEYGSYVINDAKRIDDILQTIDSAKQVWNYATYYANKCVMNDYQKVIDERGGDSGQDEETMG